MFGVRLFLKHLRWPSTLCFSKLEKQGSTFGPCSLYCFYFSDLPGICVGYKLCKHSKGKLSMRQWENSNRILDQRLNHVTVTTRRALPYPGTGSSNYKGWLFTCSNCNACFWLSSAAKGGRGWGLLEPPPLA